MSESVKLSPSVRHGSTAPSATGDRGATEERLERAALRLLQRDGVLAGLNLREVAAEAGVNRGLIYHYFGSRQDLLRSALHRVIDRGRKVIDEARPLPFKHRRRRVFDLLARAPALARLNALLVLDGDQDFRVLPRLEDTRRDLARDIESGALPHDSDPLALHVVTSATVLGYSLFREHFARDLDLIPEELDERAGAAFSVLLDHLDRG